MRGEHRSESREGQRKQGSSPHARGTLGAAGGIAGAAGIIPACAGNTTTATAALTSLGDHPRMRGEHAHHAIRFGRFTGSSPHARGTPWCSSAAPPPLGIIPACAGNTKLSVHELTSFRDHPRMRGEHLTSCLSAVLARGSSPHARGTRTFDVEYLDGSGIIPACAGNTTAT